ncbi:MAG: hypothetical protein OXG33_02855 [Chloroflexi bacterium]|nr:hypothetical protein [Chloroflexota bacterium]
MSERRAARAETEIDQPRLIGGDDVNQPGSPGQRAASSPLPSAPAPGPSGAMWMLVALVMGAAIGAVAGTVAALVIFG